MRTLTQRVGGANAAIVAVVLACAISDIKANEPETPLFTILFTAEAHGALLPCDCPIQPLGGVARRATLIKQFRERGPVILLDGGGWGAGGMYDENSDGDPERDALRNELMSRAMKLMKYDAVAIGSPENLIVNPNAVPGQHANDKVLELAEKKSGTDLRIFGWADRGLNLFGKTAPEPPEKWKRDDSKKGIEIHLSRLGSEESEKLATLSGADLVFNAGRTTTTRSAWRAGAATVVNFDYQAQRMVVVEVFRSKEAGRNYDFRTRLEPLDAKIADDPEVAALINPQIEALKKKTKKRVEIEFWTLPECPYCEQFRQEAELIAGQMGGRAEFKIRFALSKIDGKLAALHGEREVAEAKIQALILKYYPEQIWKWVAYREKNREAGWEEMAKRFGMLPARIRGALETGEADELLEADYQLAERRRITGTPSLVIANKLYEGDMQRLHILRVLCGMLDAPKPPACAEVPACFADGQCRKRGFIGKCLDAGKPGARCDFSRQAVKVPATVIFDSEGFLDKHERMMELFINDLPGVEFRTLDVREPEALEYVKQLKLLRIPAYLFDPIAKTEVGFEGELGRYVSTTDFKAANGTAQKILAVRNIAVESTRVTGVQRKFGRADLYVSRFDKEGQEALDAAIAYMQSKPNQIHLVIHDLVRWRKNNQGKRELAAANGLAELEEAARTLAIKQIAPEKLLSYLSERGKVRGSSYWDVPIRNVGIDPAKVRELAEKPGEQIMKQLRDEADFIESIGIRNGVTLFVENCEVITVQSPRDLTELLDRIASRKK